MLFTNPARSTGTVEGKTAFKQQRTITEVSYAAYRVRRCCGNAGLFHRPRFGPDGGIPRPERQVDYRSDESRIRSKLSWVRSELPGHPEFALGRSADGQFHGLEHHA